MLSFLVIADNNLISQDFLSLLSIKDIKFSAVSIDDFNRSSFTSTQFNYVVIVYYSEKKIGGLLDRVFSINPNAKIVVALPYWTALEQKILNSKESVKFVFFGEILSDFDGSRLGPLGEILRDLALGKRVVLDRENYWVVTPRFLSEIMLAEALTYWSVKQILVTGKIEALLIKQLVERVGLTTEIKHGNLSEKIDFSLSPKREEHFDYGVLIDEAIAFWRNQEFKRPVLDKRKLGAGLNYKLLVFSLILLFGLFSFPFLSLFVSGVFAKASLERISGGKIENSSKYIAIAEKSALFAKAGFETLSIDGGARISDLVLKGIGLLDKARGVYEDGRVFIDGVLGKRGYDVYKITDELYSDVDYIYREFSFLESQVLELKETPIGRFIPEIDFISVRELLVFSRDFIKRLPSLVGAGEPKNYLVLLQNNMELRPTGGFIGSFALVRFDVAKISDIQVYDVYSADGQLRGYVQPPLPIEKYLGEASWNLRDSNWDPDFSISARRAEWFLDKTLDIRVDGVIAVNLNLLNSLLEVTGPIAVSDFGGTIDSYNFYKTIQDEVESDFFPGSRKKANYLTALTSSFVNKLVSLDGSYIPYLGRIFYLNLKAKDVQVYLHDSLADSLFNGFATSSVLGEKTCSNCLDVKTGIIEANLGVNKVNYYISRSGNYSFFVDKSGVGAKLKIRIVNSSSLEKYGVYVRALAPENAEFNDAFVWDKSGSQRILLEVESVQNRVEGGVWVSVPPGDWREIEFNWHLSRTFYSEPGEFSMTFLKQSGVGAYPASFNVVFNGFTNLSGSRGFSLTERGSFYYNTPLSSDMVSKFGWKQ